MKTIKVKAVHGLKVPMALDPHRRSIGEEVVEIELVNADITAYYERRVRDGELVYVDDAKKGSK